MIFNSNQKISYTIVILYLGDVPLYLVLEACIVCFIVETSIVSQGEIMKFLGECMFYFYSFLVINKVIYYVKLLYVYFCLFYSVVLMMEIVKFYFPLVIHKLVNEVKTNYLK